MKGFTLIELLTVVLIIGVLTAISLPQYEKAVEKSRSAEAMTLARTILDAQQRALDAFPNDPVNTKGALDVILTGGEWNEGGNTYTTPNFVYTLENPGVTATRNGGEGYALHFTLENGNTCSGGAVCSALNGMGFNQPRNPKDEQQ